MLSAEEIVSQRIARRARGTSGSRSREARLRHGLAEPGQRPALCKLRAVAHRDEARVPGATDARSQREAAHRPVNQRRNDLAEGWTAPCWPGSQPAPAQSGGGPALRTPGLIIDRLSILALKIYHTREEAERANAPRATPSAISTGSPSLKTAADLAPAWMPCGAKSSPGRSDSTLSPTENVQRSVLNPAVYSTSGAARQAK